VDEASVTIKATPERVWELVTDVTKMGRFSPGNTGGKWLGRVDQPAAGAKFIGFNRRGLARWITRCTVLECERPSRFSFQVAENKMRWGWRIEEGDGGTVLTQWRDRVGQPSAPVRIFADLLYRGKLDEEMVVGMRNTLDAVKAEAERTA
jgi:uncharacterized protein YndB with AHSA1/START domain